jgi:glycosyltransferase involved in cell wall biosynthesis
MNDGPDLTVVVPAFNEETLLADSIRKLRSSLDAIGASAEIVIVNDGSRDRTGAIADELARELPGITVCHQENQGIGGAFRTGAARARGTYVMLWPADMPAEPADLAPYFVQFGTADVIVGVRRARIGYNPLMRWNAWIYPRLVRMLFGLNLRDVNWIHAYRRDLLLQISLTHRGITMLAEVLVRLRDRGAVFAEVDVAMKPRLGGIASASRWRVMWRTLTGLFAFWWAWRRRRRIGQTATRGPASPLKRFDG